MITLTALLAGCAGQVEIPGGSNALAFDGDSCVQVPMDNAALSDEMSIELTLRASASASTSDHQPFLTWPGVVAMVELDDHRVAAGPENDPGSGVYSTQSFLDGGIHHIAATWDGEGRIQLFTDGERVGFGTYADLRGESTLSIGCWDSENAGFEGVIDNVRISSVVRYDDSFKPAFEPFIADLDTTALWTFDEGGGEVAADSAGQYDGTLIGAEWVPFGASTDTDE
ncbi:MAG: hypothetical protein ACI9VR_001591 [Cognaticolwellia sp.]|jgi:hypothetical protein